MKKYTIKVGEVFTEQKAQELKEYLEAKDKEIERCTCQYDEAKKYISESGLRHNKNCPAFSLKK